MKKGSLDTLVQVFICPHDPADLLQQAVFLVEELELEYPEFASSLTFIDKDLKALALLAKTTAGDYDAVSTVTLQIIQRVMVLPFSSEELQGLFFRYLQTINEAQRQERDLGLSEI